VHAGVNVVGDESGLDQTAVEGWVGWGAWGARWGGVTRRCGTGYAIGALRLHIGSNRVACRLRWSRANCCNGFDQIFGCSIRLHGRDDQNRALDSFHGET
jgi:hypothetical protein